jgi:hypothetical protein
LTCEVDDEPPLRGRVCGPSLFEVQVEAQAPSWLLGPFFSLRPAVVGVGEAPPLGLGAGQGPGEEVFMVQVARPFLGEGVQPVGRGGLGPFFGGGASTVRRNVVAISSPLGVELTVILHLVPRGVVRPERCPRRRRAEPSFCLAPTKLLDEFPLRAAVKAALLNDRGGRAPTSNG